MEDKRIKKAVLRYICGVDPVNEEHKTFVIQSAYSPEGDSLNKALYSDVLEFVKTIRGHDPSKMMRATVSLLRAVIGTEKVIELVNLINNENIASEDAAKHFVTKILKNIQYA